MATQENRIIVPGDRVLVTGANGFIGSRVVATLLRYGFSNVRCFVRPSSNLGRLEDVIAGYPAVRVEMVAGNLLSREDCARAAEGVAVVFNLAAGIEKTFPGAFMNSVVTTRNLLDAVVRSGTLLRFVNVSSFAVYSNCDIRSGGLLDESCALEAKPVPRAEGYTYGKLKQDTLVLEYGRKYGVPWVILRPGAVYGPGVAHITSRVGIDTFGIFVHLGGGNRLPLTYVDNCAEAIVLAGMVPGIEGEVFNVVDDDLPTSRQFLRMYKRQGKRFQSVYVPYPIFYTFCALWEKYSNWSKGQLPPAFNPRKCAAYWKGNRYSNAKIKDRLGWKPAVSFEEGSRKYFEYVRQVARQC